MFLSRLAQRLGFAAGVIAVLLPVAIGIIVLSALLGIGSTVVVLLLLCLIAHQHRRINRVERDVGVLRERLNESPE